MNLTIVFITLLIEAAMYHHLSLKIKVKRA